MRVACPQCKTEFEIDLGRFPAGAPSLTCSRCRTSFVAQFADELVNQEQEPVALADHSEQSESSPVAKSLSEPEFLDFGEFNFQDSETESLADFNLVAGESINNFELIQDSREKPESDSPDELFGNLSDGEEDSALPGMEVEVEEGEEEFDLFESAPMTLSEPDELTGTKAEEPLSISNFDEPLDLPESLPLLDLESNEPERESLSAEPANTFNYQIRRPSGRVFGPFDESTISKMLSEGQLLGNEEILAENDKEWMPIGSQPAFAESVGKMVNTHADWVPSHGSIAPPISEEGNKPSTEQVLSRIKAVYGNRMASVAVVDSGVDRQYLKYILFIGGVLLLVVVLGGGLLLGLTPYGFFGVRWLLPQALQKGSPAWTKYEEASLALQEDTLEGHQKALQLAKDLLAQNELAVESRAIFVQSVFYLNRKYHLAKDEFLLARRYLEELILSAQEKTEVIKARAGFHLLKGESALIRPTLESVSVKKEDVELLFLLAECFIQENKYASAVETFQKILKIKPGHAKALAGLGQLAVKAESDYLAAMNYFQKAYESNPRHLSSALAVADIQLENLKDPKSSLEVTKNILLNKKNTSLLMPTEWAYAHALKGKAHVELQEHSLAVEEFEKAIAIGSPMAYAAYGQYLLSRRNYQKASELFEMALRSEPKNIKFVEGRIRSMIGASKFGAALKALSEAAASYPGNPVIAFLQGRISHKIGNFEEAENNYQRAMKGEPLQWEPYFHLGELYIKTKRFEEAQSLLNMALEKAPKRTEPYAGRGDYFFEVGKLDEAKLNYHKALEIDPEYAAAHAGLAQVLSVEKQWDEARKEYEIAASLDSHLPKLFSNYGKLLWDMQDWNSAEQVLEKAKELDIKDSEATWRLGAVYFKLGKLQQGLVQVDAAIILEPKSAPARYYKALIHYRRNEINQAIDAIKSALERDSQDPEYYYWNGMIMHRALRTNEAIQSFQQALKLKPDYAEAMESLGKVYQELRNFPTAIVYLEKASRTNPKDVRLTLSVSDSLFSMRKFDKAIPRYLEVFKLDSSQVGVFFKIGRCYGEKGNLSQAIEWYAKAVRNDPQAKEAWRLMGYAYKEQNRKAEAVHAFEQYLENYPEAGDAKDIREEILYLQPRR